MTAQNDLDRTLSTWFGAEAAPAVPPEPLARIIESTRGRRPRPSVMAGIGSHSIGAGPTSGLGPVAASLRPALVIGLVALMTVALVGGALLVASRLSTPAPLPRTYLNELVSAPDLSTPMTSPVLVTLADGRVLVVGDGGSFRPGIAALIYDPATGASVSTGPMVPPGQWVNEAVPLKDGRVLILGDGVYQVFDPTTLQFTAVGLAVTPRSGAEAALLHDGRVLIAGGLPPGDEAGVDPPLRTAELFDPATMTSTPTGSFAALAAGSMATLPDGRVFMGTDNAAEIYNSATGTFSAASTTTSGGSGHPVVLPDGRVVLAGPTGMYSGGRIQVWDPASGTFSAHGLPEPLFDATLLDDGRVFLIGMCHGRPAGWTGVYDPRTEVTTPTQGTLSCRPASTRLADGRVLIVGGLEPATPTVQIFR